MEELTIKQLQERLSTGELTSVSLVESYLKRIDLIDKEGPALNAVIEINPDALAIADALDAERKTGETRGPLHGVTVLLKDNFDTADKMTTTAGSLALEGSIAAKDSFVAQKLRKGGVIILGKANLSKWANFRSTHSSSGWSSRGGQTRNPYVLDRSPGGSSSGSGVAVSANLTSFAIGTETDGSIISPSQTNGIVGIKPTLGLISRTGIVPLAHNQDTGGPMARTVEDAALVLSALTGEDPDDPATLGSAGSYHSDYTQFLDPDGLRGTRIGVARNLFGRYPKVDAILEQRIKLVAELGAEIVDPANIETANALRETEYEVLLTEFKHDLDAYLANLGPGVAVHTLDELIEFNEKHRERMMPYFGQEHFVKAAGKGPLTNNEYRYALMRNHLFARDRGIDATLEKHELDAIIAPSGGPACLIDWVNGDCARRGSASAAAVAGYPSITVPAGFVTELPFGISFIASAFQEPTLIKLAYAFEQATKVRRPPEFKQTVSTLS